MKNQFSYNGQENSKFLNLENKYDLFSLRIHSAVMNKVIVYNKITNFSKKKVLKNKNIFIF